MISKARKGKSLSLDAVRKKSCILWAGAGFSLEASFTDGARLLNSRDLAYHLARKTYKELEREREPTRNEHVAQQVPSLTARDHGHRFTFWTALSPRQ